MESNKKNSIKHFTTKDREIFKSIVKEYAEILENKRTDATSSKLKNNTWENITLQFNQTSGVSEMRRPKQLRNLWNNMKAIERNALINETRMSVGTGGGPSPSSHIRIEPDLAVVVPHLMVTAPRLIDFDMTAKEMDVVRADVMAGYRFSLKEEEVDMPIEVASSDATIEKFGSTDISVEQDNTSTSTPVGECRENIDKTPLSNSSSDSESRKLRKRSYSSVYSINELYQKRYDQLLQMDLERSEKLKQQDEILFQIKKKNEEQKGLFELEVFHLKKKVLEAELRLAQYKIQAITEN